MAGSGGRALLVGAGHGDPGLLTQKPGRSLDAAVAHPGRPVLEWLDRRLLDTYQRDFPICEKLFAEIASRLHCQASDVLRRLAVLERCGVVSRVGPVFAPGCIDSSTLAAMAVPRARLESVAECDQPQRERRVRIRGVEKARLRKSARPDAGQGLHEMWRSCLTVGVEPDNRSRKQEIERACRGGAVLRCRRRRLFSG